MSAYRSDLDALEARHTALSTELAQKTKELDDASRLLTDAKAKLRLPVLDNIRVASPCSADWNAMTGDQRVRACGDCKKNVYNVSEMTRDEAQALIIAKEGKLCVRYYQRTDGTILLADCTIGVAKKRKRKWIVVGAAALLAGGAGIAHHLLRGDESCAVAGDVQFRTAPIEQRMQQVTRDSLANPEFDDVDVKMGKFHD